MKLGHGYDASRLFLKDHKKETKDLERAILKALEDGSSGDNSSEA